MPVFIVIIIIIIINRHFKHAKLQKSVAKARAATYQIVTKTVKTGQSKRPYNTHGII